MTTKIPAELSSTPGIVDNSDATAITINSSEDILLSNTTSLIGANTSDGSDNKSVMINGGGAASDSRGAYVWIKGNEHSDAGFLQLNAGNVSGAGIKFFTAGSEKARIISDGGITFNGDTAAANALDDYEEGTWTGTLTFGGGSTSLTYSVQTGYYMKVGRIVTATIYVLLTNKGSSTGNATLSGLPYTALGNNAYAAGSLHLSVISFSGFPQAYVVTGSTFAYLGQTADSGTFSILTNSNFSNNSGFIFTVTYQTA
jgi:hypothetical protein